LFACVSLWDEKDGFYYDVLRDVKVMDTVDVTGSRPEKKEDKVGVCECVMCCTRLRVRDVDDVV
jgi:hypothetical protein